MSTEDIAVTKSTSPPDLASKVKPIPAQACKLQAEGFQWREFLVRLPAWLTLASLNDPTIWREIQGSNAGALSRGALQRLDHLLIVSHDEAWAAQTIVTAATHRGVTLSSPVRIGMDARTEILAGDDNYQLRWDGQVGGYFVERRSDGRRMTVPASTQQQAMRELEALYPKRGA